MDGIVEGLLAAWDAFLLLLTQIIIPDWNDVLRWIPALLLGLVGLVVAVIAISRHGGALVGEPELVARGYVVDEGQADTLFRDAAGVIAECIEASSHEERTDQGLMTEKLRVELRRFFKKRSGRRPLVLPILMEI